MKNYISLNIKYLCDQNNLHYNEFAEIVDAGRSVVSMWAAEKSSPKIEAIQKICAHFNILIDDFINKKLADLPVNANDEYFAKATESAPTYGNSLLMEQLQSQLNDKERIIKMLERENSKLRGDSNYKTA